MKHAACVGLQLVGKPAKPGKPPVKPTGHAPLIAIPEAAPTSPRYVPTSVA